MSRFEIEPVSKLEGQKVENNQSKNDPEDSSVCSQCGEEYAQPLLTELHSGSMIEEYYACPRCLTKVGEVEHERVVEPEKAEKEAEAPAEEEAPTEAEKVDETQPQCAYHMGYLKKRDKGSPIPEGCFTCPKMIGCI